jgi:tetratricopeptide (TPR) repeat protein
MAKPMLVTWPFVMLLIDYWPLGRLAVRWRRNVRGALPNLRVEHNLGVALGASGRYDEAAVHFEKTLQIDGNFYDGLVAMGVTRAHQGRLPEAIEYLQAAIRSQPEAPKAHVQLAHAL